MRIRVDLDDRSLEQAALNGALRELADKLSRRELLAFKGKLAWEGDLKAMRESRQEESTSR
jgi:hypothetical protein